MPFTESIDSNPQSERLRELIEEILTGMELLEQDEVQPFEKILGDSTVDDLINTADHLRKLTEDAIEKLEKEGKHLESLGLKFLADQMTIAEQKLEAMHSKNDFEKIDVQLTKNLLQNLENTLNDELKRVNTAGVTFDNASIDDLLNTVDSIFHLLFEGLQMLIVEPNLTEKDFKKLILKTSFDHFFELFDEIKRISSVKTTVYSTSRLEDLRNTIHNLNQLAKGVLEKIKKKCKVNLALELKFFANKIAEAEVLLNYMHMKNIPEKNKIKITEVFIDIIEQAFSVLLFKIAEDNFIANYPSL